MATTTLPKRMAADWMTQNEACRELGIVKQTLWRWRKKGIIEARTWKTLVVVRRADVRRKLMNLPLAD